MRVPKWAWVVALSLSAVSVWGQTGGKKIPRVSGSVMSRRLVVKVAPIYPLDARQADVQGTVMLHVVVGTEGKVESVEAVSGPKMLLTAAMDAVRRWVYRPYVLNGKPSEVQTTVSVNFSLKSTLSGQILPS